MSPLSEKELQASLITLLEKTIEKDNVLRVKYEVTNKFRFVSDRLKTLLEQLETDAAGMMLSEKAKAGAVLENDETLVYVHLYNANGLNFKTWKNMMIAKVFYEYSVNRPIYVEKSQIDAFIRGKAVQAQHGYLTMAVKSADVLTGELKDGMGHRIIKVKEGSLRLDKLMAFTHNDHEYSVNAEGELVKKGL